MQTRTDCKNFPEYKLLRGMMTGACLCILLYCFSCGTMKEAKAYFCDTELAENKITVGINEIEGREEFPDPEIEPGKKMTKEVKFLNTGTVPCKVRARVLFNLDGESKMFQAVINTKDWELQDDGYYYYKEIVAPGEETSLFLEAVQIAEDADVSQLEGLEAYVYAESIQAEGSE